MKRWKGFALLLDDIRFPLSNNEAERTIRHAVVGRKNYHGSKCQTGAESAKKNVIDPRQLILMSLKRIAAGKPVMTPLAYAKHLRLSDPTLNQGCFIPARFLRNLLQGQQKAVVVVLSLGGSPCRLTELRKCTTISEYGRQDSKIK